MSPQQKLHDALTVAAPWISTMVLGLFSIIGYFLLQELSSMRSLEGTVAQLYTDTEVMKSNRFTSADGLAVWKEIQVLQTRVVEVNAKIPTEVPPAWFAKKVDDLATDMDRNGEKIGQVLTQLQANTVLIKQLQTP